MVYCTKCGAGNPDDAETCTQCGAPLYPVVATQTRGYKRYRSQEECFGIPRGSTIVGLVIGLIILLWGLIWLFQRAGWLPEDVSVWPFAIIIFGMLIVIGALYGLSRKD